MINLEVASPFTLTWHSDDKVQRALCTLSRVPTLGKTSLSQSGPEEHSRPRATALPSISSSKIRKKNGQ